MDGIDFNPADLVNEDDDLIYPFLLYSGKMVVFVPSDDDGYKHQFGGALPADAKLPETAMIHLLFDINVKTCSILSGIDMARIPLVFPFRHDGGQIEYRCDRNGAIDVLSVSPELPTEDWPYENYPDAFTAVPFASSKPIECDREEYQEMFDDVAPGADSDSALIAIPPSEDYGVSLWGEIGDAEWVECAFVVNTKTGMITAETQCS